MTILKHLRRVIVTYHSACALHDISTTDKGHLAFLYSDFTDLDSIEIDCIDIA